MRVHPIVGGPKTTKMDKKHGSRQEPHPLLDRRVGDTKPMTPSLQPYPTYKPSDVEWLGDVPAHWDVRRTKTALMERSLKGFPNEPLLAATQTKGVVRKEQYENRTVLALKDLHLLKLVRVGDFVISLRSFQGGIEYAREQGIISPAYTILYPRNPDVRAYLAWLFKSPPYIENLTLHVTGIRQREQNIDYSEPTSRLLPSPPTRPRTARHRPLPVDHVDAANRRRYVARQTHRRGEVGRFWAQAVSCAPVGCGTPRRNYRLLQLACTPVVPSPMAILSRSYLPLPPVPEQRAIVRYLDHVDERIRRYVSAKEQFIALLEEERQAVIHHAVTRGRDPNVRLKPSGVEWLGDVPVHWEVRRLKTVCRMKSGDGITAETIDESGDFPVYGGNGLRGYTSSCTHDGEFALIGRQGALCGNVHIARGRFWASEHAVVATLLSSHVIDWFGAILIAMNLNQYSISAAQPGLAVERVLNLHLPVPPVQEQKRIADQIRVATANIDAAISRARRQIELLREYRTRLIADVVTGKLDVRDAAAELPSRDFP